MKQLLMMVMLFLFGFGQTVNAQQNQKLQRSKSIFVFKDFQDASIRQSFGRKVKATANIYLKDASLCYMENGKIMRAYTKGIFGVDFGDSIHYMKVDSAMARVVAQKGYTYLLKKTTVNMPRYREEESGGRGLDFFEMSDFNVFMDMNEDLRDEDLGIPLQDKYYFSVKGRIFNANETAIKDIVIPSKRKEFKALMEDRLWSWKDENSLKMLLDFLP